MKVGIARQPDDFKADGDPMCQMRRKTRLWDIHGPPDTNLWPLFGPDYRGMEYSEGGNGRVAPKLKSDTFRHLKKGPFQSSNNR